jgi:phosphoribosylanthranilate isomerase
MSAAPVVKIKVCGVTLPDDAAMVAAAGVDFIGLNFWPRSRRHVEVERAPMIAAAARAAAPATGVRIVGLFVDAHADEIVAAHAAVGLDRVQLHGDESPDDCRVIARATGLPVWKAIAVASARDLAALADWPVDAILLDAPTAGRGGSGTTFDWALAADAVARHPRLAIVLAGGLGPDNVAAAIAQVRPFAVDVASGVERAPGVKDADRVHAFVAAARAAGSAAGGASPQPERAP